MDSHDLQLKSIEYRRTILRIIHDSGGGHTGGSLSCVDILNVLYNQVMTVSPDQFGSPDRDRYVQSKGHSVEALYTVLADCGFFPTEDLNTLNQFQSHYVGHPTRKVNGIEQNTGALGHGLSVSVGMALAGKTDAKDYRVFTLLGDGELTEGSNWEALMAAAHYQLDNLVVIIDRNTLQITGRTEDVMALEPLKAKFEAFGCAVCDVDGHDLPALVNVFDQTPFEPRKPNMIIARTIKGRGVSFMEDSARWHHRVPTEEEFALAMQELGEAESQLRSLY